MAPHSVKIRTPIALTASGLLRRENGGVSAPYDAITAEMRL
jgi:hypothetical protein